MRLAPVALIGAATLFILFFTSRVNAPSSRPVPAAAVVQATGSSQRVLSSAPMLEAAASFQAPPPPPPLSASAAWLQKPPTPIAVLRKAALTYFPQMGEPGTSEAIPERFDGTTNPCWSERHCLPGFLILGVYQSGVRDLYNRLQKHPGVAQRPANSPSFYSQVRPNWPEYVHGLDGAATQALSGKLLGEASAVTFHFVWVHQEKFNQPYVESMGKFWRACNARPQAQKDALPHRLCMAARMADAREADAALARSAGVPFVPDRGDTAEERAFSVPQLVRAVYGAFSPALLVLLRKPWRRMHSSFFNYPHYSRHYGATAAGESQWAREAVLAFRRCESNFTTDACALSFESLTRENEEVFYHCDQLIKGMYQVFLKRWRKEHRRLLLLRAEEYYTTPKTVFVRALRFLRLQTPKDWRTLLDPPIQRAGPRPDGGLPPMPASMEATLREFYAPGLAQLVAMLKDEPDAAEWRVWAEGAE